MPEHTAYMLTHQVEATVRMSSQTLLPPEKIGAAASLLPKHKVSMNRTGEDYQQPNLIHGLSSMVRFVPWST